jgi:group I intron endonuclease
MIGNIYKIIVNCSNQIYIGSTQQECRARWQEHKDNYKQFKNGKSGNCSAFDLFDKFGIDNCKIILIKQYEIVDRKHLRALEQLWINKLKPINKLSAFVIDPILKEKISEYMKKYREEHKEEIAEVNKKYREEHKEEIAEINKKYREEHKEEIAKRKSEKITCEICNCEITRGSKSRHEKSKKHKSNLTKQPVQ